MIAVPAIDLRDGACVQLVGGSFADERIRIPNVLDVARTWRDAGFGRLHIVDLDAASGIGSNSEQIDTLLRTTAGVASVGGGVRTTERVENLLSAGADRVIVGTRAFDDEVWLASIAARFAGRIVVAVDVRERRIVTRAWTHEVPLEIADALERLNSLPLAGVLVTAVHREGRMQGPDTSLIADVVRVSRHPVTASGGIGTIDDLRGIDASGAAACVIGMALYTGALDPRAVAKEFRE